MTQKARIVTVEDIWVELDLGGDLDDIDEPIMAGSDDEFRGCDLDENENGDNTDKDNTDVRIPTHSLSQPLLTILTLST